MDLGIAKKRVLVTGASQGIGRSIALAFAREECRVAIVARRKDELIKVVREMGGESKGHGYCAVDLMKKGAAREMVKTLSDQGGNFDVVIHNLGGTLAMKDPLAVSESWADVWRLNVGIAIDINHEVIDPMREKKWGRIVHVSSLAAANFRGAAAYAAAKAYLNAYTVSMARVFAKEGLVISALMPGVINSPGGPWDETSEANRKDPQAFLRKKEEVLCHHQPIGRLGTPEDIAPFAVFMASEQAAFATGSIISVAGAGA